MLLTAAILTASAAAATPPDVGFDRAMADRQCAADVKAEDLDGQIECLDYQLRGRRLWVLFAADRGSEGAADMEACSSRWTEDGITDWRMAGSCLTEAGDPLAAARGKRDFDEKGLHILCADAGDSRVPPPPSSENRSPVEECVFDNAVDYRIVHLLEKAYGGALGKSFAYCRSNWTENGIINWRMTELCEQLQIRAQERLADWR